MLSFQCLVACGKGHKHRQVWCQFGEDRLNDRICDPETKPASMQTCQQPECASWQAGPWGQVFQMIKFLTTFFPFYLERAYSLAFQHQGFHCCDLRYSFMAQCQSKRNSATISSHFPGLPLALLLLIIPFTDPCTCLHS